MKLLMENFRKFVIEEEINNYINNTHSLTEQQLRKFVVTQYAKKNIILSEQQLNEVMPKWLKILGAKAAMLGTVSSLAMGTVAQAGVISDIPISTPDGSEAAYTLTADEIQLMADTIEGMPDEVADSETDEGESIKDWIPSLERVADHPTADVDYDNLSDGELRSALRIWAQAAHDRQANAGDTDAGSEAANTGQIVDNNDGTFSITLEAEVGSSLSMTQETTTNSAARALKGELGDGYSYRVTSVTGDPAEAIQVTVTASPAR